jgi:amidase
MSGAAASKEAVGFPSALELAEAIRKGELTSRQLVEQSLARIAERDGKLNAFVTVDSDGALAQADRADRALAQGRSSGPLHGVPIGIKDLTSTAGLRTTFSSRAHADYVPDEDAASVRRVRGAGMVIVGKTNTSECGALPITDSELNGVCFNPWDPSRNAGGSSGGSAVAVATGMLPIAHGTDAGGSIRIPAAFCGVYGIRPSRGRISMAPRAGERLAGFSTEGPLGRTVADAAALLDVLSGYEPGDPYVMAPPATSFLDASRQTPGALRVAYSTDNPMGLDVDPEHVDAVERIASQLALLGHRVERAAPEWGTDGWSGAGVVWSTLMAYYDSPDLDLMGPDVRALELLGRKTSAIDYVRATVGLQQLSRRIVRFWGDYDILVTPVTTMQPFSNDWLSTEWLSDTNGQERVQRVQELVSFTRPFNITGQPAASVPVACSRDGLPIGVQIVGPPGGDALVLQLSAQLEGATGWSHDLPAPAL